MLFTTHFPTLMNDLSLNFTRAGILFVLFTAVLLVPGRVYIVGRYPTLFFCRTNHHY